MEKLTGQGPDQGTGQGTDRGVGREQLSRFARDFEELSPKLGRLVVGLSAEQFFWKPSTKQWSIAEAIEHLSISAELTLPEIQRAVAEAVQFPNANKRRPIDPIVQSWVAATEPPPKRKLRAPKLLQPKLARNVGTAPSQKEVLERFMRVHQLLAKSLSQLESDKQLFAARARFRAVPLLTILLGQYFELLIVHARRHLYQAEQVKLRADFPGSQS